MKGMMKPLYRTQKGVLYNGSSEYLLKAKWFKPLKNKINLIFTSPPFPLNRRKAYGNLKGDDYIDWLANFADIFRQLLHPKGSIVIELGNAWERGKPTMSILSMNALLEFKQRGNFHLCQEFIWHNIARLPSPAQWVNVERIRVKDAFTRLWWLSTSSRPKANNRKILKDYSPAMKHLLKTRKYNAGQRPSEHSIGQKTFLKNHGGSIPSNVISISNTKSNDPYLKYCRKKKINGHPARMPPRLAEFFIKFLTKKNDIVMDPFAGSNVTGCVAEKLNRRWRCIEKNKVYARASRARFSNSYLL